MEFPRKTNFLEPSFLGSKLVFGRWNPKQNCQVVLVIVDGLEMVWRGFWPNYAKLSDVSD